MIVELCDTQYMTIVRLTRYYPFNTPETVQNVVVALSDFIFLKVRYTGVTHLAFVVI